MNKYLTIFGSHSQYVEPEVKPNVSYCIQEDEVHYNPHTFADEYFATIALESGTISFNIWKSMGTEYITSISYSTDNGETWTTTNNTNNKSEHLVITVNVNEGDKVMWKGDATRLGFEFEDEGEFFYYGSFFSSDCEFNVQGNIMSLLYEDNYMGQTNLTRTYAFYNLFQNNNKIISAKNLSLPATTLATGCYRDMFRGCTSLVNSPELPATTLKQECYSNMFRGCTSLIMAPKLPATTLANHCYLSMFYDCVNLTIAPELPVTTLATQCYGYMFQNCTSLTNAPSVLPATTLTSNCYDSMFRGCTSLTTAPELPARTLKSCCYQNMFFGCTKLNYIKAMFTTTPSTIYTNNWVYGVAASGTFVKNSAASWTATGVSGIPTGWTVETVSE